MTTPASSVTFRDAALLCFAASLWAVNALVVKYALLHTPPLLAIVIRFMIAAAILIPFWKPAPGAFKTLAVVGAIIGAHYAIQSVGLWLAHDLAPMVIAMQVWIPASVIFASIFLGERMGAQRIAGVIVSFLGIVILAADVTVIPQLGAFALVALAAAMYGGSSVLVRRAQPIHPLAYQAWIAIITVLAIEPISLAVEPNQIVAFREAGWGALAALAFSGVASNVVANALMFRLVQKYEVARTTPFMFLTPVVSVILGVVFLHDPITAQFLFGAAVTTIGVALSSLAGRQFNLRRAQ